MSVYYLKSDARFIDNVARFIKGASSVRTKEYLDWWRLRDTRMASALQTIRACL